MTTPESHLQDAQKLEADGVVELYEVQLVPSGVLYIKNNNTVTYQGNTYDGIALQISGVSQNADEEVSRPQISIAQRAAEFSAAVAAGNLNNAIVIRKRVLLADVVADNGVFTEQSWRVGRVVTLNKHMIVLELRGQMDSQFFLFPPRIYMPPDFPQVSLA